MAVVEVCVGEPSSDCGMRGLSTNFAFRRGAGSRKHRHTHTQKETTRAHTETQRDTHINQGDGRRKEREE